MCAVSYIGDHYTNKFKQPDYQIIYDRITHQQFVTIDEFNALKREIEEMKAILLKAHEYDMKTNQPHCHQDEKVDLLKKFASALGVSLRDIFPE